MSSSRQIRGFSLVELLIVVAIILIVAAIGVPNYLQSKMRANEAVAVANVRTLVSAQALYSNMFPQIGYAPDVQSLGGQGGSNILPNAAGLVDANLSVAGHGYLLSITARAEGGTNTGFTIYGQPTIRNVTGRRCFCANETGVIKFSDDGSSNCTSPVPF